MLMTSPSRPKFVSTALLGLALVLGDAACGQDTAEVQSQDETTVATAPSTTTTTTTTVPSTTTTTAPSTTATTTVPSTTTTTASTTTTAPPGTAPPTSTTTSPSTTATLQITTTTINDRFIAVTVACNNGIVGVVDVPGNDEGRIDDHLNRIEPCENDGGYATATFAGCRDAELRTVEIPAVDGGFPDFDTLDYCEQ